MATLLLRQQARAVQQHHSPAPLTNRIYDAVQDAFYDEQQVFPLLRLTAPAQTVSSDSSATR